MQLNNISLNRVAKVDKIDFSQNEIVFSIYEFGFANKKISQERFTSPETLKDFLNQSVNCNNECLRILKENYLTGYELSGDAKNWAIQTGSTGDPTLIRVFVPYSVSGQVFNTGNALDILLKAMDGLVNFLIKDVTGGMQYLEYLLPEHRAILEQYPEIVIQERE